MYFCKNLINTLWEIRHQKDTTSFKQTEVQYLDKKINILSRASRVTVFNHDEKEGQIALLTYSDQSPLGYSQEAELVRQGYLETYDAGWLFLYYTNLKKKLWLGKIVKGCITVIRDCKYYKDDRKVWLYPPKNNAYHKVIPISSVSM